MDGDVETVGNPLNFSAHKFTDKFIQELPFFMVLTKNYLYGNYKTGVLLTKVICKS